MYSTHILRDIRVAQYGMSILDWKTVLIHTMDKMLLLNPFPIVRPSVNSLKTERSVYECLKLVLDF
jgi:hypothetical protein